MSDEQENSETRYIKQPKLLQTHVFYKDRQFFVSTIRRYSSSMLNPDVIYSETMVWELDTETGCRQREILYQTSAGQWCIKEHQRVVEALYEDGKVSDFEEEENE